MNIGEIQVGGKLIVDEFGGKGVLRCSTFIHQDNYDDFKDGDKKLKEVIHNTKPLKSLSSHDLQFPSVCKYGGLMFGNICTYLLSNQFGLISIFSSHYPLGHHNQMDYLAFIKTKTLATSICISKTLEKFIHEPMKNNIEFKISFIIMAGSFNSMLMKNENELFYFKDMDSYENLYKNDNIYSLLKTFPFVRESIKEMHEGVNDEIDFPPTYPVKHYKTCDIGKYTDNSKKDKYHNLVNCYENNLPLMYSNRILYTTTTEQEQYKLICRGYDMIYNNVLSNTKNAGVGGFFTITK